MMKNIDNGNYIKESKCYDFERRENPSMLFDNLPEIIRPRYTAKLLGLSVKTIYDWKYRGEMRNIPSDLFIKINRSLYIRTDVLRRWVTSN